MKLRHKNWNYGPGDPVTWGRPVPGTNDPRVDDIALETAIENVEDDIFDVKKRREEVVDSYLAGEITPIRFLTEHGKLGIEIEDLRIKKARLEAGEVMSGENIFY